MAIGFVGTYIRIDMTLTSSVTRTYEICFTIGRTDWRVFHVITVARRRTALR